MSNTKHIEQMIEKYYKKPFEEITATDIVNSSLKFVMNPAEEELEKYVDKRLKEHTMKLTESLLEYYPFLNWFVKSNVGLEQPMELSEEEMDTVIEKIKFKHKYKEAYRRGFVLGRCAEYYREINLCSADEQKKTNRLLLLLNQNEEMVKEWMQNIEKHFILELRAVGFDKRKIMAKLNMPEEVYEANEPSQEEIDEYKPVISAEEPIDEEAEDAYNEYMLKMNK